MSMPLLTRRCRDDMAMLVDTDAMSLMRLQ